MWCLLCFKLNIAHHSKEMLLYLQSVGIWTWWRHFTKVTFLFRIRVVFNSHILIPPIITLETITTYFGLITTIQNLYNPELHLMQCDEKKSDTQNQCGWWRWVTEKSASSRIVCSFFHRFIVVSALICNFVVLLLYTHPAAIIKFTANCNNCTNLLILFAHVRCRYNNIIAVA